LNYSIAKIANSLIVSCQPVPGGPLDSPQTVVGFALAAVASGAKGLRIEGLENLKAVRTATKVPIIGLIKRDLPGSPVRISPLIEDVQSLAAAGADIIAFDATLRSRPVEADLLCQTIKRLGKVAMADISTLREAQLAIDFGADLIGTTMSGYTGGPEPDNPDFDLLRAVVTLGNPVIAEGRIRTPDQASLAIRLGAHAVVVGSAITRPEHITSWFALAIEMAKPKAGNMTATHSLGIDIGGTKTLVCLIDGAKIIDHAETPTLRHSSAAAWCDEIARLAKKWHGQYGCGGAAVTGIVNGGRWSALSPDTLPVPDNFPLASELEARLGKQVHCVNDAQAGAWGEYKHGAGKQDDLFFITVSTGIGGGAVVHGQLATGRGGMSGSAGNLKLRRNGQLLRVEDVAAGLAIAGRAKAAGQDVDAKAVFAAAASGEDWARQITEESLQVIADLVANIQLLIDPPCIVIGGGIGLAPGVIENLRSRLSTLPAAQRPEIRPAALGKFAGAIGAADLAQRHSSPKGG
jgi:N-acetylmannosamine-6-phosphate 2-epimerase / N-acetylmannosamine kinase